MFQTRILEIDPYGPDGEVISQAVEVLNQGGIICFPTETVYGLGVKIFDDSALEKLFSIKGRRKDNPFSIFLKDTNQLREFVESISPSTKKLTDRFWPGPLTLVFKSKMKDLSPYLLHHNKVGIRVSSSPLIQQLLQQLDQPITATSANLSGESPCFSAEDAKKIFWGKVDLILDGGESKQPVASTVLDVSEEKINLIREGSILLSQIREVLPEL